MDELEAYKSIIERIMTQHWDLAACTCWICQEGTVLGCAPREKYLDHKYPENSRPHVSVEYVHVI